MNRSQTVLALSLVTLSAAGVVQAISPPAPTRAETEAAQAGQPSAPAPPLAPRIERARLSPMHQEIEAAVEAERSSVDALNRRFLVAPLAREKLAIQKEIEAIKKNGMITIYEIQLRYATAEGRTAAVEQLRTTLEALRNPKARPEFGG